MRNKLITGLVYWFSKFATILFPVVALLIKDVHLSRIY